MGWLFVAWFKNKENGPQTEDDWCFAISFSRNALYRCMNFDEHSQKTLVYCIIQKLISTFQSSVWLIKCVNNLCKW